MKNQITIGVAATHTGVFHADDVFSAALLQIIDPTVVIKRVFKAEDAPDASIVFDIGGGEYDHHQPNARVRPDGVKYAAFGLLWERFGSLLVSEDMANAFDRDFVQPIDAADNGASSGPITLAIAAFNPNWDEAPDFDGQFRKAVDVAKIILERQIALCNAKDAATAELRDAVQRAQLNGHPAVVLDRYVPWQGMIHNIEGNADFSFVVSPAARGGYQVQAIPTTPGGRDQRIPFPAEWVTNRPAQATFVHAGRFLVATVDLDSALEIAQMALSSAE